MKRSLLAAATAIVAVLGCAERPALTEPEADVTPTFAISDGANGGNPHFFFLPPLVPRTRLGGTFNPNLMPVVEICRLDNTPAPACVPGPPVERFETVRVNARRKFYRVNWNTHRSDLQLGALYRIRVLVGSVELGFRDVRPVRRLLPLLFRRFRSVYNFIPVRTIPIKFRIETGALCDPDAIDCGEGTLTSEGGIVTTPSQEAGVEAFPGSVAEGQEVTVIVERLAQPCLPTDLPQFDDCYRFRTEPPLPNGFEDVVTVGVCIDPAGLAEEQQERLLLHRVEEPFDDTSPVFPLPNVSAAFVECPTVLGHTDANWLFDLAYAGGRSLLDLVAPRAHALHRGLGGSTLRFSRIGWVLPAKMTEKAGNGQVGTAGQPLPVSPAVFLTDSAGAPVAGVTVTFSVESGGGSVAHPVVVTGPDGIASTPWTLGVNAFENTLVASARGAVGSPVRFTALGCPPPVNDIRAPAPSPSARDRRAPDAAAQTGGAVTNRIVVCF